MTVLHAFGIGAACAFVLSLLTVLMLRPHLADLLEELCGSRARASFWMVISALCIFLVGILAGTVSFGYGEGAQLSSQALFFGLVTQVRAGLIGLLSSLIAIAWILLGFVQQFEKGLISPFHLEPEPVGWRGGTVANPNAPPAAPPASDPSPWRRSFDLGDKGDS